MQEDGLAILDQGISFGGGQLLHYGINSNTSAIGFLKCIMRKQKATNIPTTKEGGVSSMFNQNPTLQTSKANAQKNNQKQKSNANGGQREKEKQKSQSQAPSIT